MNLHAEMLLHCVLASREDMGHAWIHETLRNIESPFFPPTKSLYPGIREFVGIGTDIDFGYVLVLHDKIICAVSGTKGPLFTSKAWRDNCRIIPDGGLHRGWKHGAEPLNDVIDFLVRKKSESRPFKLTGLSRGHAVSQISGLHMREGLSYTDVEHVGFRGPIATNKRGYNRMKAAKLRSTRWWQPGLLTDPVDDFGTLFGKHYGLSMKLPDPPNDVPVMDHDYTNTCDSMYIKMSSWGLPVEADFCASLKRFCMGL